MKRIIATALAITAGTGALASDDYGALDTDIRGKLTAEGYEVRKIEAEDGRYEAYALKDGDRYEIYLDRDLKIVKTKMDD